jgi:phosphatidylinositol N-acetylglucosaminyltransferase subunit Q
MHSVYNHIWLCFFDVLLGIFVTSLLYAFSDDLIYNLKNLFLDSNEILRYSIEWFMGEPGGFKLNEDLSNFLGTAFTFYIEVGNSEIL